jgi:hypothetical protein
MIDVIEGPDGYTIVRYDLEVLEEIFVSFDEADALAYTLVSLVEKRHRDSWAERLTRRADPAILE